jgi:hypothetical protein
VQPGPGPVEASTLRVNPTRLFSDYRFPLLRFLLTYRNEYVTIHRTIQVRTSPGPPRQFRAKYRACNRFVPHSYKNNACKPFIYSTYVNTSGVYPSKAKPRRSHSANLPGGSVRRCHLPSLLEFALPGSTIADPVGVTASRIHPFGSPLSLHSAIAECCGRIKLGPSRVQTGRART